LPNGWLCCYSLHKTCYNESEAGRAVWLFLTILLAVFWAVTGFHLWRLSRPRRQLRIVDNTARQLDLALDAHTGPLVRARLVRRERVALAGTTVLMTAYLPLALTLDHAHPGATHPVAPIVFVLPFLIILGSRPLLLSCLLAYEALRRCRQPGPRVARVVVPRVTDYVRPVEVWAARALTGVVVPGSALIVGLAQHHRPGYQWLSGTGLILTAVSGPLLLALVETGARRLAALPQPAATPIELAWDDALRSMQLRELYLLATTAALLISVLTLGLLESSFIAIYGVLLVVLILSLKGSPASHYRRRLWPWPTDGETA
jgi:hypothetical protein